VTTQLLVVAAVCAVAIVVLARFELLCVRDLRATPDARLRHLTRTGWLVVIVVVIPLGGLWYLLDGKQR
jgi:hypothetical protein